MLRGSCAAHCCWSAGGTSRHADLAEFIELLKRQPNVLRFASGGVGTVTHLAGDANFRLGVHMTHVPYRGTGPALTDLVAGNIWDIYFSDTSAWPMVQQDQIRLLAVTSTARWATSPDVPPVGTAVPGFNLQLVRRGLAARHAAEPVRALLAAEGSRKPSPGRRS